MRNAAGRRVAVPQQASPPASLYSVPAPILGWVLNQNLANQQPNSALQLDNWVPTQTGIRLRGGSTKFATISVGEVEALFPYVTSTGEEFFGADANNIFNITDPADPDVIPTADVTGQTSGDYSTIQITTTGGDFLYAVNGDDAPQLYDGTTWQAVTDVSAPIAITGVPAGFTTADFSFVWLFANRLFFVLKDSRTAVFLPVDSVGGAAGSFSLDSIFGRGGTLQFGGTWSQDSGAGLDDKCVFVSSEGQVAIFGGTDPSTASTFALQGVYDITKPLGKNATMVAGGDFVIATEEGLVPVSEATLKDPAALSIAAVSRQIEQAWKDEVLVRRNAPWEILKWSTNNMVIVALPVIDSTTPAICFVVNLETGAWSRFTGWETQSVGLFDNAGYFGNRTGQVFRMEDGGSDDGAIYTGDFIGAFDHFGMQPGIYKSVKTMRTVFRTATEINPQATVATDYNIPTLSPPNSGPDVSGDNLWDSGLWDVALWDAGTVVSVQTKWHSIGRSGFAIAPIVQVTNGVTVTPDIELVIVDFTFVPGGVMV